MAFLNEPSGLFSLPFVTSASSTFQEIYSYLSPSELANFKLSETYSEHELQNRLRNGKNIPSLLNALKQLLALHFLGRNISPLLPDIVNTLSSKYLDVKLLVYALLGEVLVATPYEHSSSNAERNETTLYVPQETAGPLRSTSDAEINDSRIYSVSNKGTLREIALLSVSAFQKDLKDRFHLVRAASLRCLSSLQMLEVLPIVIHAIEKAVTDPSPYVRKTSTFAIFKVFQTDPDLFERLRALLLSLFNDIEVAVVSAAVLVFYHMCILNPLAYSKMPLYNMQNNSSKILVGNVRHDSTLKSESAWLLDANSNAENLHNGKPMLSTMYILKHQSHSLSLLHPHYRRLCELLTHLEPSAQAAAVDLLLRYCRYFFADPFALPLSRDTAASSEESIVNSSNVSKDFRMFLCALETLLHSQHVSVVIMSAAALLYAAPLTVPTKTRLVNALLRCLHMHCTNSSLSEVLFYILVPFVKHDPSAFVASKESFYLFLSDKLSIRTKKVELLETLCYTEAIAAEIFAELQCYITWPLASNDFLSHVMTALTRLSLRYPSLQTSYMKWLIRLLDSSESLYYSKAIIGEAVVAIRTVLQHREAGNLTPTVAHFVGNIHNFKEPIVRVSVLWIIGRYQHELPFLIPDTLRILSKGFRLEDEAVRLQILSLAMSVWSFHAFALLKEIPDSFHSSTSVSPSSNKNVEAPPRNSDTPSFLNDENADHRSEVTVSTSPPATAEIVSSNPSRSILDALDEISGHSEAPNTLNTSCVCSTFAMHSSTSCDPKQSSYSSNSLTTATYPPPVTATNTSSETIRSSWKGIRFSVEESRYVFPRVHELLLYMCNIGAEDASFDVRDKSIFYKELVRQVLDQIVSECKLDLDLPILNSITAKMKSENSFSNNFVVPAAESTKAIATTTSFVASKKTFRQFCFSYVRSLSIVGAQFPTLLQRSSSKVFPCFDEAAPQKTSATFSTYEQSTQTTVDTTAQTLKEKKLFLENENPSFSERTGQKYPTLTETWLPYFVTYLIGDALEGHAPLPEFTNISTPDSIRLPPSMDTRKDIRSISKDSSTIFSKSSHSAVENIPRIETYKELENFYLEKDISPSALLSLEETARKKLFTVEQGLSGSVWQIFQSPENNNLFEGEHNVGDPALSNLTSGKIVVGEDEESEKEVDAEEKEASEEEADAEDWKYLPTD